MQNEFMARIHNVGEFVHVYKITFQKGNHIGKSFQSKELKSNHGVRIPRKIGENGGIHNRLQIRMMLCALRLTYKHWAILSRCSTGGGVSIPFHKI